MNMPSFLPPIGECEVDAELDVERFVSLLDIANRGRLAVVPELREIVAQSDAVAEFLCENDELALEFDAVVARWKSEVGS